MARGRLRRSLMAALVATALLAVASPSLAYATDDTGTHYDALSQSTTTSTTTTTAQQHSIARMLVAETDTHSYTFDSTPTPATPVTDDIGVVQPAGRNEETRELTPSPTMAPSPPVIQAPAVSNSIMLTPTSATTVTATATATDTATSTATTSTTMTSTGVSRPTAASASAAPAAPTLAPSAASGSNDVDQDAIPLKISKDACPAYNEITTACNNVCGNNGLCIKYRSDGECLSSEITKCVHPKDDPCVYECLAGTSSDIDQWLLSPTAVPAWNASLHDNKQVEAIRALDVPRNITQVSFQFLFDALKLVNKKGLVAAVKFPDKRLMSNTSLLRTISLVNVEYRKIPAGVFPPQLQYLVLENCLLSTVPDAVLALKNLNLLNLASNTITKLPTKLAQLPLNVLYLDDNEFTEFPALLTEMSSLKTLSLQKNRMTEVKTIAQSSGVTELALDYNQLTDFAGVLPSVIKLFLRGNQLTTFPSTLTSLTNLEIMDLTENALSSAAIEKAAVTLTHPNLKELILSSNGLQLVPALGNVFPELKTLSVRNNSIEKVEGQYSGKLQLLKATANKIKTFTASFMRLTSLDLFDNHLDALPDVASISGVLQSINVSKNGLKKLVDVKPMNTLTSFNASKNNLTEFDLVIPSLRMLDLSTNKFKAIPKAVWTYTVLDELHLEGNPDLVDVVFEPDQFYFLKRLSVLTLDASSMKKDCAESWKTQLKGVSLCVKGLDTTTSSSGGGRTSTWTFISIAVGSVAAFSLVAFVVILYRRRHDYEYDDYNKPGRGSMGSQDRTAGLTGTGGMHTLMRSNPNGGIWDDQELQERRVDYDSIKFDKKLAAGAYGEVWIGTYRTETVAIKTLTESGKRDKTALSYFIGEIKLLAQLDHPRIVAFYGVAWTCMTDICVVIEFMPGGDLYSLLRSHLLPNTHWNATKLQIALDMVEALTYVHTLDEVLIHRDLKSRNVLLDDEFRAKVTDFGISRFQRDDDQTMTSGMGTGRWMAPEIITGSASYDEKVDVYSFGVILSELDTHQMPYALNINSGSETNIPLTEMAILQQVAAGELQPNFSRTCPDSILDIAQKCLAYDPKDRPSSLEVAFYLRKLIPEFPCEEPQARPSSVFSRSTWTRRTNATASRRSSRVSEILMTRSSPGEEAEISL